MMRKKVSLLLIFLICLLFATTQTGLASAAQRVAILPVTFMHSQRDADVESVIKSNLLKKFHTPLAEIVPIFEIIPDNEVRDAVSGITTGKKYKLDKTLLTAIAEKTNADIVIGADAYVRCMFFITWDDDVYQNTDLSIKILCYHKASGTVTEQKGYDSYNGYESLWGQPDYMAEQLMFKLLNKIPDYSGLTAPQNK